VSLSSDLLKPLHLFSETSGHSRLTGHAISLKIDTLLTKSMRSFGVCIAFLVCFHGTIDADCPAVAAGTISVDPVPSTLYTDSVRATQCPAVHVGYAGSDGTRVVMTFGRCCRSFTKFGNPGVCSQMTRRYMGEVLDGPSCRSIRLRDSTVCFLRSRSEVWDTLAVPSPIYAMAGLGTTNSLRSMDFEWTKVLIVNAAGRYWNAWIDVARDTWMDLQAGYLRLYGDQDGGRRCSVPDAAFIYIAHDQSPKTHRAMPSHGGYLIGVTTAGATTGSGLTSASHAVWTDLASRSGNSVYHDVPNARSRQEDPGDDPRLGATYMRLVSRGPEWPSHASAMVRLETNGTPHCSGSWVKFPSGLRGILTAGHCAFAGEDPVPVISADLCGPDGQFTKFRLKVPDWRRTSAAALMLDMGAFRSRPSSFSDMGPREQNAIKAVAAIGLGCLTKSDRYKDVLSDKFWHRISNIAHRELLNTDTAYDLAILIPEDALPTGALGVRILTDADAAANGIVESMGYPGLLNQVPILHPPNEDPGWGHSRLSSQTRDRWTEWRSPSLWSVRTPSAGFIQNSDLGGSLLWGDNSITGDLKPPHVAGRELQGLSGGPAFLISQGSTHTDPNMPVVAVTSTVLRRGGVGWACLTSSMERMWLR
jgi:hypothetical protein